MEENKLEYSKPEHKLKLFTMGLNLEVQPYWLIKEMISENSKNILNLMIENQFRVILKDFKDWQDKVTEALEEGVDPDYEFVKHKTKVHIKQIQDVADLSRDLLPLHSDWELIATEEEVEIMEMAHEYWKYNDFYGHER